MHIYEAKQVQEATAQSIADWCGGARVVEHSVTVEGASQVAVNVPCKGAVRRAPLGSMVVQYMDQSFDVMSPDVYSNRLLAETEEVLKFGREL